MYTHTHTHTYIYIYIHTHTHNKPVSGTNSISPESADVDTIRYGRTHNLVLADCWDCVCTYVCVCMCVCMDAPTTWFWPPVVIFYVCIYVCVYVCMCMCIWTRPQPGSGRLL